VVGARAEGKDYILAIDIGTSACKVAVFDRLGNVLAAETRSYPVYYSFPGYAEQKPGEWWASACEAIRDIFSSGKIAPSDIKTVGVDGQSWSCIIVDKHGQVLFDNPIWMDTRAEGICAEVKQRVDKAAMFEICGNPFEPMYTTPKILWFKRNFPEIFKSAYKVLQSNSYIVYKLTGELSLDSSQGYGLHCFDMHKGKWDSALVETLGIPMGLLPDISEPWDIVGHITQDAARATGLLAGTPVVAGGLDAACSTLGGGVCEPGQTQEQGGQAGGMSICLDRCITHKKLIMGRHVVPNRWILQGGTVGGGGALKWLREVMLPGISFSEMSELATQSRPGSNGLIFLPYMSGERSPIWDKSAKGVFFGLDYAKSRCDIIRAVMEGVAFSLLHNIKTAEEAGAYAGSMHSVGGSANSSVWMQIKSDVTGKPMRVPSSDTATTLGAAMLAGIGVGIYESCQDAIACTAQMKASYEPNMQNHEIYRRYYDVYLELYENLKGSMKKISGL